MSNLSTFGCECDLQYAITKEAISQIRDYVYKHHLPVNFDMSPWMYPLNDMSHCRGADCLFNTTQLDNSGQRDISQYIIDKSGDISD